MKLVMVGGHTRNIGKTSVVEGIIRGLPEMNWTAVKITQFGHGVCSTDGKPCGCVVSECQFAMSEERETNSGTDTARFLAAGARRSLWLRTRQGDLSAGLPSLTEAIENDEFVIVESNSLRQFLKPALYFQVLDPHSSDFKASAQQFFDSTDAYLLVTHRGEKNTSSFATEPWKNVSLAREIEKNKPCFFVSAGERFVTQPVLDFVRSTLIA